MNKKTMFSFVFLMFGVATTALPVYEQEREVLYTMHTVGQDFAQVNFVKDNVDMFISVFKIHADFVEAKLAVANQKAKKAMAKNSVIIVATILSNMLINEFIHCTHAFIVYNEYVASWSLDRMVRQFGSAGALVASAVGSVYSVVSTYDALKERNALKEALALDQEILEKLITIKELAMFSFGGDVAEDATDGSDAKVLEAA